MVKSKVLIIGAAGAVGKRLTQALARAGSDVIASDRHDHLPSSIKNSAKVCVGGIDVRDEASVVKLFKDHADKDTAVWNLASPLSVETAMSYVVGGGDDRRDEKHDRRDARGRRAAHLLHRLDRLVRRLSPRTNCSARWLIDNPDQDQESDYGRQKRAVRNIIADFETGGGDPRVAVLPNVLHSEPVWGGTTEYALDAMLAASKGETYACPVDPDVPLPMVFADDLMRGLMELMHAEEADLKEPQRIYCIPGLSFTANELFHEIRQHVPDFKTTMALDENMAKFAKLWPDTLSLEEPLRDLDYEPFVALPQMVANVLTAHGAQDRQQGGVRSIDTCESGYINPPMLEKYVRKYAVRGRNAGTEPAAGPRRRGDGRADEADGRRQGREGDDGRLPHLEPRQLGRELYGGLFEPARVSGSNEWESEVKGRVLRRDRAGGMRGVAAR